MSESALRAAFSATVEELASRPLTTLGRRGAARALVRVAEQSGLADLPEIVKLRAAIGGHEAAQGGPSVECFDPEDWE